MVDIIVYNPNLSYEFKWGTSTPIPFRDPETGIPVDIKCRGSYDVRIANVDKFHSTLVGSDKDYTIDILSERLDNYVYSILVNELAKVVHKLNLGYIDFPLHQREIADAVQPIISETLNEQYGLYVPVFNITAFFIDDEKRTEIEKSIKDDKDEIKFRKDAKELAEEIERLDDKKWDRTKFLIQLRREDESKYLEVIKLLGIAELNSDKEEKSKKEVKKEVGRYCPSCGSQVDNNDTFCPSCGTQLNRTDKKCPHCGKISKTKGKYCPHCGKEF